MSSDEAVTIRSRRPSQWNTFGHVGARFDAGDDGVALVGTGLSTVALALLAHDLASGNARALLGTALAMKMAAYVGIASIAGGFAHRPPRRRLLIGLDIARAAVVACRPPVAQAWQVCAMIFVLNARSPGFRPTWPC